MIGWMVRTAGFNQPIDDFNHLAGKGLVGHKGSRKLNHLAQRIGTNPERVSGDLVVDDLGQLEIVGLLELAGLADCFRATVSSEEVERGKPAPDVYLEAARRLGAEPGRCAAVEDSHAGIRSAKSAGTPYGLSILGSI